MTQYGHPGIQAQFFVDAASDVGGTAGALRHHHHVVGGARQTGPTDLLHDLRFKIHLPLGDQHGGGTHGDAHIQRQMAGVAAHDLHHGAAFMGLHGVPQLVDALHGRVAGSVKANGVVGAADVVVDGGRDAHDLKASVPAGSGLPAQCQSAPEGTVAADGHNSIQSQQFAGGKRFGPARLRHKFLAAGGVEYRAALVDDMADAGCVQLYEVAVDQAVPASPDAYAFNAAVHCGPYDGPHSRVHTGGVTTAGQYADPMDLMLHGESSFFSDH